MFLKILAVFIGGGIGAFLRYVISLIAKKYFFMPIIGTLTANIIGCFFIGYIYALTIHKPNFIPIDTKLFITVGFLGGLTTFSTLNLEIFELLKSGKIFLGFSYLFLSCFAGLIFTLCGYMFYTKL